jgi:hypothetical protein
VIEIRDMPKLECPFVRNENHIVTPEIAEGYEWVFNDPTVKAIEKLHGTNVSILIQDGIVTGCWNRETRIPFFNRGKKFIIEGLLESYEQGYMEMLPDGQHFGELIGEKVNGNPYKIKKHLWIPFSTYANKKLVYKSWGRYPKTFEAISEWFKTLMPLYALSLGQGQDAFVEGVIFTHPNGYMAKLRKDMYDWHVGRRHGD